MTPRSSWGARVYRTVQRLLPVEFRGDFGEAMAADLAERSDTGGASSGVVRSATC
jgi:hypothetical protein